MKGRKAAAIILSTAIIVSSMGTVTMAESSATAKYDVQTLQKATDSNADPGEATPSEPDRPEDATPSDATHVSTEGELRDALESSDNIVLDGEIKLAQPLLISNDDVTLSGGKITYGCDGTQNYMIHVEENAKVTFRNITIDARDMDCSLKSEYNGEFYDMDYYAITVSQESNIIIEEGTYIVNDNSKNMPNNTNKRAVFIGGDGKMNGGKIYGFLRAGVLVGGTFEMNGGEIKTCGGGGIDIGGKRAADSPAGERPAGSAIIKDGLITRNGIGIANAGDLVVEGGNIIDNGRGIYNYNHDGRTGELFSPYTTLKGGFIAGNRQGAIINTTRGTVIIEAGCVIADIAETSESIMTMSARAVGNRPSVIMNTDESSLEMRGGQVIASSLGGTAITNDSTSTIKITGGEILAIGEDTTALINENTAADSFVVSGGKLAAIGAGSQLFEGFLKVENNVEIAGEEDGKYTIATSHNEGGTVTSSAQTAAEGETVTITITPDPDFMVSDVAINNVKQGLHSDHAIDYTLTVSGRHFVYVIFERKASIEGNGSGGNSSGGSSSGTSVRTTKSAQIIPETPGSWLQDAAGWKYLNTAGSAYSNIWIRKNHQWYFMGEDGYMKTGWNLISGKWYYLMPVSGEMKTGWIADGGAWYYADETGARVTGWVKTNEKWYYLNVDGKMAVSTTTPDGYSVDENGVWH